MSRLWRFCFHIICVLRKVVHKLPGGKMIVIAEGLVREMHKNP